MPNIFGSSRKKTCEIDIKSIAAQLLKEESIETFINRKIDEKFAINNALQKSDVRIVEEEINFPVMNYSDRVSNSITHYKNKDGFEFKWSSTLLNNQQSQGSFNPSLFKDINQISFSINNIAILEMTFIFPTPYKIKNIKYIPSIICVNEEPHPLGHYYTYVTINNKEILDTSDRGEKNNFLNTYSFDLNTQEYTTQLNLTTKLIATMFNFPSATSYNIRFKYLQLTLVRKTILGNVI